MKENDSESIAMETLYDLLGALPNDDADDLRAAFRRAVKRAHPDVNPDDPDAGLKFRRIVRANEILGDAEQRGLMIICWKSRDLSRSRWQSTLSPSRSTRSLPP
jgi:curved DNA-binding protein CbpA